MGININTVPVLDVKRKNSHKVIGDRSFSENPEIVSELGKICIELHERNKIFTVIKHIPGHGLSKYDSHKTLPTIKSKKNELINKDFKPFKFCKSLFAMTAHVKYFEYDPIYISTCIPFQLLLFVLPLLSPDPPLTRWGGAQCVLK